MINISALAAAAAHYDTGDPRRVQHFIKVYGYCRLLGLSEGLDTHTQNMLEAAALLHDIGIHEAERRHGSSAGPYQEQEGPGCRAKALPPRASVCSGRTAAKSCSMIFFSQSHTLYKDRKSADTMFALFAYLSGIIACWSVSTDASSLRP